MRKDDHDEEKGDGLLSRWSKRKLAARAAAHEEPADVTQAVEMPTLEEQGEDRILKANREAAEAIDIEALNYESDFGPFLKAGVPAILKRRALRKLWRSNPVLANVDGLNDYDTDFSQPSADLVKSAWEAGRGYLDHLARERESADAEAMAPAPEASEVGDDALAKSADTAPAKTEDDQVAEQKPALVEGHVQETEPTPTRVSLRQRLLG